ncbi:MAG: DUF5693 family protein [Armatimonadota bacterium]
MIFRRNRFLTILLIVGVIGAMWALALRYRVETHNRTVEVAVDYSEVAKLAGAANMTVPETLTELKRAGVTSLSVEQPIVSDLIASGQVAIGKTNGNTVLTGSSKDVYQTLIESSIPVKVSRPFTPSKDGLATWELKVKAEPDYVLTMPVALPDEAFDAAKETGLAVVARLSNYPGVGRENMEKTLSQLEQKGVKTVIFSGDEVLGFRGAINDVADALKAHGLVYGSIEFSKQKGDQHLSEKMLPDVLKVHSITAAEMGTLDKPTAVERFVKAAKERDIRLLYVRMFDFGDAGLLKSNIEYIREITRGLTKDGMGLKVSRPFTDPGVPVAAMIMMAIGVAAGVMLLAVSVIKLSAKQIWASFILIALIFAGMAASGIPLGGKLIGLVSAIVFPSLAVITAAYGTPEKSDSLPLRTHMWEAAGRFIGVVAISVAGGMMIAGLLAKESFMMRADQFAGVKLAHLLPILIAAFVLAAGIGWGSASWHEQVEKIKTAFKRLSSQPVLIWHTAIALVLLVMLGLLLARSGNDSGVGVSGIELRFRSILDKILYVRPRTKEFLIGHPALFLGIAAALGGRRGWAALLLVIGTIGEVSIVNTFCHIHTPIFISAYRVTIGSVLGLALGIVLLLMFSRFNRNKSESAEKKTAQERVKVRK